MQIRSRSRLASGVFGLSLVASVTLGSCGGNGSGTYLPADAATAGGSGGASGAASQAGNAGDGAATGGAGAGGSAGSSAGSGGSPGPCQGLACQQTTCTTGNCTQEPCAAGLVTTVSGTVYDPAGKVPLYNATVYVPNGPALPATPGASCNPCGPALEDAIASARTDARGSFVLQDVPVGTDIPLVIQIGKWRRRITVPTVTACADTLLIDVNQTRLPRNKSEGEIPLIAIATGGGDSMECLPLRMGIDPSEFTTETGDGRIHLFSGTDVNNEIATKAFAPTLNGGATLTPATGLWSGLDTLARYDVVILSCEGGTQEADKPPSARQSMYDYASLGGRVFASHWHHIWLSAGPTPLLGIGTWSDRLDPIDPTLGTINGSFAKGQAFADWLFNVGASTTLGELVIYAPRDNIQAVSSAEVTSWLTLQNTEQPESPNSVQYLSFNTPLGVAEEQKCGRIDYTSLHVSATGNDFPGEPFPDGCELRDLSAQEKALEFQLFDLPACP